MSFDLCVIFLLEKGIETNLLIAAFKIRLAPLLIYLWQFVSEFKTLQVALLRRKTPCEEDGDDDLASILVKGISVLHKHL